MKITETINTSNLKKLGSKRKWVPLWLWVNVFFRFGMNEIWPINIMIYKPVGKRVWK